MLHPLTVLVILYHLFTAVSTNRHKLFKDLNIYHLLTKSVKYVKYAYHKKDAQFFKQFNKKDIETGINFIKKYIEHAKQQIKNF